MGLRQGVIAGVLLVCVATVASADNHVGDKPDEAPQDTATPTPIDADPAPSRFGAPGVDEAYGAFQRGLYLTARNLAVPRAEAGDGAAMTLLAEIYTRGLGVPVDRKKAEAYYRQAANLGVTEAEFRFGLILLRRAEDRDGQRIAAEWMKRAADKGHARAQFNYAQALATLRPGTSGRMEALEYFERAAKQDIADAQFALAKAYLEGTTSRAADAIEARMWMEEAARANFVAAQVEYGAMLVDGIGGPKDVARGFGWVLQAARSGSAEGQLIVSQLYRAGIGVEPDSLEAAAWYVMARRSGARVPIMEDFWLGLSDETQRSAIARANTLI
ncbi:MAG: tetratricopeptide repeat protein [Pseudomonadota bacterium]